MRARWGAVLALGALAGCNEGNMPPPMTAFLPEDASVVTTASVAAPPIDWAAARRACPAAIVASSMQPIPRSVAVSVDSGEEAPNPTLAQQFIAGLRREGVQVSRASPLRLQTVFSLSSGQAGSAQALNNFTLATAQAVDPQGAKLVVTAQVVDLSASAFLWIASIQCEVRTSDPALLSAAVGQLVGRNLGNSVMEGGRI